MTIRNTVYFNGEMEDNNNVTEWVGLVAHETSHVADYDNETMFGFLGSYFISYYNNLRAGESDYQAYENIPSEQKGLINEGKIKRFFGNEKNKGDFMAILGDKSLNDTKKANRMEALGIERVKLPEVAAIQSMFGTKMNELQRENNPKNSGLINALKTLINAYNNYATELKDQVNQLRR